MKLKSITLALLVAVLFGATAIPTQIHAQTDLSWPVTGTTDDGGTFTGTFDITEFDVQNDQLMALGTLTGTVLDASGREIDTVENAAVAWPVQRQTSRVWLGWVGTGSVAAESSNAASAPPVAISQTCDILNLVLGPLDLNLLGLEIHLDTVILDIVADPAGGLLGQLLCAVANLLSDPLADLLQIVELLNQILDLLG